MTFCHCAPLCKAMHCYVLSRKCLPGLDPTVREKEDDPERKINIGRVSFFLHQLNMDAVIPQEILFSVFILPEYWKGSYRKMSTVFLKSIFSATNFSVKY